MAGKWNAYITQFFIIFCWFAMFTQTTAKNKTVIHFGALINEFRDRYGFKTFMEAAVDLINKDDDILKDYQLKIDIKNTIYASSFVLGVSELFDLMKENSPPKQAIIAAGFSKYTKKYLPFSTYLRVPQISYTARQRFNTLKVVDGKPVKYTRLQDKPYPFYVRMTPSNTEQNRARIKIIQHFKWKRVAIFLDDRDELLFNIANDLSIRLRDVGITVTTTNVIRDTQSYSLEKINIDHAFDALKAYHGGVCLFSRRIEADMIGDFPSTNETNTRVIIALIKTLAAKAVFCEIYKRQMYGTNYTWIGTDYWGDTFYKNVNPIEILVNYNCTESQLLEATSGMINFAMLDARPAEDKISPIVVANMSAKSIETNSMMTFIWKYRRRHLRTATYAFDAVLAAAIAIDKLIKREGEKATLMNGTRDTEKALRITEEIFKSDFEGLTGRVYFGNKTGDDDRKGEMYVRQWFSTDNYTTGSYKSIALYNGVKDDFKIFNKSNDTLFTDGKIRRDGTIMINEILSVTSINQIIGLWALTGAGVIVSIVFLSINVIYRKIRLIKMSSPNINNGIVLGSLLCYLSIILIGLDTRMLSKHSMEITCNILPVSLSIGFTFTFGCLFSKTWRVYKIFSAARTMEKVNTSALKDIRLYSIVLIFVAIDIIISLSWILISPFTLQEVIYDAKLAGDDTINSYFYYKCSCEYEMHFTIIMYCYKGLVLAAGVFLALETRNIKVAALNDSQYIGMAVYNVVIVTIVGLTCHYSLTDTSNYLQHGYLIVAFSIFMCTASTTIFVFAPKIHLLLGRTSTVERAMSVQTFSFAASVTRKSWRRKKELSPVISNDSVHRQISSESSSSNSTKDI